MTKTKGTVGGGVLLSFISGFEPLARAPLYLTVKNTQGDAVGAAQLTITLRSHTTPPKKAQKRNTASNQGGHSRERPRGTAKQGPISDPPTVVLVPQTGLPPIRSSHWGGPR